MCMFDTSKTLIVVYKDELLMNQLRKLIETHDDTNDQVIGTKDDSIDIISWSEPVWLDNKKKGTIKGKVLFLDEIKDTDQLVPVLDLKLNECGVYFGWAGNQAILFARPSEIIAREDYDAFLEKLSALPVPELLKATKEDDKKEESTSDDNQSYGLEVMDYKKAKLREILYPIKNVITSGADAIEKVGNQIAVKSEVIFRDKDLMKRQMLFYGVIRLYNDYLEEFMNR